MITHLSVEKASKKNSRLSMYSRVRCLSGKQVGQIQLML